MMNKYLIKKILMGLLTVFAIITIVFVLMRLLPTDYYFSQEQLRKLNDSEKYNILKAAGLTDPIGKQLLNYYKRIFSGDFGISRRLDVGVSVIDIIKSRLPISMLLGGVSLIISIVLGTFLGMFQTIYKDKLGDHLGTAYTIFVRAVPTIVSYSLVLVLGAKLFHLPMTYSSRNHPISSLIMPIICLSLPSIAGYAIWMRRFMVNQLNSDYIRLAEMKGLTTFQVMFRHVLRNAAVPMVQYIPVSFLLTIGGSMLVESFFSIPGTGMLFTSAIRKYDLDVVSTLMLIYSSLSVGGIILGDILMSIVDPRISLTENGGKN